MKAVTRVAKVHEWADAVNHSAPQSEIQQCHLVDEEQEHAVGWSPLENPVKVEQCLDIYFTKGNTFRNMLSVSESLWPDHRINTFIFLVCHQIYFIVCGIWQIVFSWQTINTFGKRAINISVLWFKNCFVEKCLSLTLSFKSNISPLSRQMEIGTEIYFLPDRSISDKSTFMFHKPLKSFLALSPFSGEEPGLFDVYFSDLFLIFHGPHPS